jgi:hypothetical protein
VPLLSRVGFNHPEQKLWLLLHLHAAVFGLDMKTSLRSIYLQYDTTSRITCLEVPLLEVDFRDMKLTSVTLKQACDSDTPQHARTNYCKSYEVLRE